MGFLRESRFKVASGILRIVGDTKTNTWNYVRRTSKFRRQIMPTFNAIRNSESRTEGKVRISHADLCLGIPGPTSGKRAAASRFSSWKDKWPQLTIRATPDGDWRRHS